MSKGLLTFLGLGGLLWYFSRAAAQPVPGQYTPPTGLNPIGGDDGLISPLSEFWTRVVGLENAQAVENDGWYLLNVAGAVPAENLPAGFPSGAFALLIEKGSLREGSTVPVELVTTVTGFDTTPVNGPSWVSYTGTAQAAAAGGAWRTASVRAWQSNAGFFGVETPLLPGKVATFATNLFTAWAV